MGISTGVVTVPSLSPRRIWFTTEVAGISAGASSAGYVPPAPALNEQHVEYIGSDIFHNLQNKTISNKLDTFAFLGLGILSGLP